MTCSRLPIAEERPGVRGVAAVRQINSKTTNRRERTVNCHKRLVLCVGMIVLVSAGARAQDRPATTSPPNASASPLPTEQVNIDFVKSLEVRGTYVHLVGSSLFVNPGRVLGKVKQVPPEMKGGWFDIADDPAAPKLLAGALPSAWDVVVVAGHAIACDYEKLLTVYDLRDHAWREVARLPMPSMTENIVVRGNLAYVANHEAGLTIVDVSQPTRLKIVANFNINIDCDAVALWNHSAVLYGHHQGQVVLADISDPARPRQTGLCQLPRILNGGEMEVDAGLAYVTSNRGLFVVDVRDPVQPTLVQTIDLKAVAHDVLLVDGYAFVAADQRGVRVFDVRDPRKPTEVGRYQRGAELVATALAVTKAPAPATGEYYIYLADMSGPAAVLRFRAPLR